MPISEKILSEINKLDAKQAEKDLLLRILELEDQGVKHYVAPYEREIANYLEKTKKDGEQA